MKPDIESDGEDSIKINLYKALYDNTKESYNLVIDLCKKLEDGPLHVCTIHNDTPLHKLAYVKKFDLADELLDLVPENSPKITFTNDWGNNLLHNASTSNKGVRFAMKLLTRAPEMLTVKNRWGETAAFQAVRYGRRHVFLSLAKEIDALCARDASYDHLYFFQREDKTTILQMAILTGYYDIGVIIARRYPLLCNERAKDGHTALQLLACTPFAFFSGNEMGFFKKLIYKCISSHDADIDIKADTRRSIGKLISSIFRMSSKPWCTWPAIDKIRAQKKSHKDVQTLAEILVSVDTSWERTFKPGSEVKPSTSVIDTLKGHVKPKEVTVPISKDESQNSTSDRHETDTKGHDKPKLETIPISEDESHNDETPLILAAKTGCIEIVKGILDQFPQAVEYLNHEGQNVSLVAVKNRNLNVFKLVMSKNLDLRSNLRVIDRQGNCILHMVGLKKETPAGVKLKTPLLQLSDDLQLFEDVQSRCPAYLLDHRNNQNKTPYELMVDNNEKLRNNAKEWLRRTAEHCTAIIILIATVAFAAAYTVPGGPNQQTGFPILIGKPFFLAFTMSDVLSLTFALTAAVIFLSLLTSSYKLQSFSRSLPQKVLLGLTLLFLSVSMMMVSFAATVILMTSRKKEWTKIAVYIAAFFPICIFVLSYVPLYINLANTFRYWFMKCRKILPVPVCAAKPKNNFRRGGI